MKGIYELNWNVGRGWRVEGIFVADSEDISKIIGKTIYFGEVCGKHSEVELIMDKEVLYLKTDDQEFIAKFEETLGEGFSSGINPLDYYDPEYEDEEDFEE